MIRQEFRLSVVDWKVVVFYDADSLNEKEVRKELLRIGCKSSSMNKAMSNIRSNKMNSGFTYSNLDLRESVMVIGKTTSAAEFANTYNHEKGHLLRHISKAFDVDPYGEEEQYIDGEISGKMFGVAKRFMCDSCRKERSALSSFFRVFSL